MFNNKSLIQIEDLGRSNIILKHLYNYKIPHYNIITPSPTHPPMHHHHAPMDQPGHAWAQLARQEITQSDPSKPRDIGTSLYCCCILLLCCHSITEFNKGHELLYFRRTSLNAPRKKTGIRWKAILKTLQCNQSKQMQVKTGYYL